MIIGQAGDEPKAISPVKPLISIEWKPVNMVIGAAVAATITFMLFRGECMAKCRQLVKSMKRGKKRCRACRKK